MNRPHLIIALIALVVAGCSSSEPTKDDRTYYLAAFEDFEVDEYPEVVPPLPSSEIEHDIPDGLLVSDPPRRTTARGYRVQVFASRDKRLADEELQRAILWWENHRESSGDQPPIYVEYEQPFFKVRVGNYRTRSDAARDSDALTRTFQAAFVVPATIDLR